MSSIKRKVGDEKNNADQVIQTLMGKEKKMNDKKEEFSKDIFLCSICADYMVLPSTLMCGHNYCKECIVKWIDEQGKGVSCPVCRKVILGKSSM